MVHVPILRAGVPYRSLETARLSDQRDGSVLAEVSQANRGLIARDLQDAPRHARALRQVPAAQLVGICRKAAQLFTEADLPIDEGATQSPTDYLRQLSGSTCMPVALCRANMEKIRFVLDQMAQVMAGLTRGLDLAVLDGGWGMESGRRVAYRAEGEMLGAVLPNNSPGVHSLWVPAFALKYLLVLKPGRQEPWTPLRIIRALMAAGAPRESFFYYPTDHAGAAEILLRTQRSLLFGDAGTLRAWQDDPRVQLHGPGWSKVILGRDAAPAYERYLDVMEASVADNGGRSCLNTSGIWAASHGRKIAEALAARLARIEARGLDDPAARLCGFAEPRQAELVSRHIDNLLAVPGATDMTAALRKGPRVARAGGVTFLMPTVIWCEDPEHPLAACEFLFPFVSVVEMDQSRILSRIGSTLVATVISDEQEFQHEAMSSGSIDRLNLGPMPTSRVSWDQPHEGNLFQHLYRQRALQSAGAA